MNATKYDAGMPHTGAWDREEEEIPTIDLGEFEKRCKALFEEDRKIAIEEEKIKAAKEVLDKQKAEVMAILKKYNKEKYPVDGLGVVRIAKRWSWKVPQDMQAKKKFFDYLKKEGIFMELVSVNSQTLNSYCKKAYEVQKELGNVDWNPDGLESPTLTEKLQIAKR
jgi:hypothetical protein